MRRTRRCARSSRRWRRYNLRQIYAYKVVLTDASFRMASSRRRARTSGEPTWTKAVKSSR